MAETLEPAHVALLRSFLNTRDLDDGSDRLSDAAGLRAWLHEQGLTSGREVPTAEHVERARALRDGLRASVETQAGEPAGSVDRLLESAADALPLRMSFRAGQPGLEPALGGVPGALTRVLVAVAESAADGSWGRVKLCAADDCRWSFYDVSKNRSRTWCDMSVCGNRRKSRAYRQRHRDGS